MLRRHELPPAFRPKLAMLLYRPDKNALEWKRCRRICPSCGREIHGRTCNAH